MKGIHTSEFKNRDKITSFFIEHWGSPKMIVSTGMYECDQLPGFVVLNEEKEIIGAITYFMHNDYCEIVSLDSLVEKKGIGSMLLDKVEQVAKGQVKKIKLITTNDNIDALAFYQKRGFRITKVFPNAVDNARKIKQEIPLLAQNGIPIRDEILLEKSL